MHDISYYKSADQYRKEQTHRRAYNPYSFPYYMNDHEYKKAVARDEIYEVNGKKYWRQMEIKVDCENVNKTREV